MEFPGRFINLVNGKLSVLSMLTVGIILLRMT